VNDILKMLKESEAYNGNGENSEVKEKTKEEIIEPPKEEEVPIPLVTEDPGKSLYKRIMARLRRR